MLLTFFFQCWETCVSSVSMSNHFIGQIDVGKNFLQLKTAVK